MAFDSKFSGIEDQVIAVIAQQAMLDVADVTPSASLESLGIDSLGLVESIFALEEAFDISVPFNANDPGNGGFDITSVGSIIRAIEGLIALRPA